MTGIRESTVEAAALDWLRNLGYRVVHAPEPGPYGLRDTYGDVVLRRILRDRLANLNPDLPADAHGPGWGAAGRHQSRGRRCPPGSAGCVRRDHGGGAAALGPRGRNSNRPDLYPPPPGLLSDQEVQSVLDWTRGEG